jgi:hypothetical protein
MSFLYGSGEQIMAGDLVLLHGEQGHVVSVHDPAINGDDWYVKEFEGGVMIVEPKTFGTIFIPAPVCDYEGLIFLSRGESNAPLSA